MKSHYYSYLNVKSQRNTYITVMLIYVSLALNVYVWILYYMYKKRSDHELALAEGAKGKEKGQGVRESGKIGGSA
jgi:hypothetical protein